MSTNGSFTPPSDPACVIPTTRAALIALRDANGLDIQCHYQIPGPVIGTAGNTSPTTILMHAATTGDLSRAVSIDTTFDNVAFVGNYNIDAAPDGDINLITDHWNNTISDEDTGAPTVHTQFPYHVSGPLLRDNEVNDCTLTGWDSAVAAGVLITDNELLNAGIHLTGMTAGSFIRNKVQGPQITVSSPNVLFTSNEIRNAPVTFAGTNAGPQSFQSNIMASGLFEVTAATTGAVDASRNVIGGTGIIGYRVRVDGAAGAVSVSGNRLFNQGPDATQDLRVAGAGAVTFDSNEVGAGTVDINAAAAVTVVASPMVRPSLTITAGTSVTALRLSGGTTTVAAPAGSTVADVDAVDSTFNVTGPGAVTAGSLLGSSLANAGFGLDTFEMLGGTKTLTATQNNKLFSPAFDNYL